METVTLLEHFFFVLLVYPTECSEVLYNLHEKSRKAARRRQVGPVATDNLRKIKFYLPLRSGYFRTIARSSAENNANVYKVQAYQNVLPIAFLLSLRPVQSVPGLMALSLAFRPGLDATYLYLYGGTDPDIDRVGFIIVQVKNGAETDLYVRSFQRSSRVL